ncbi:MAG: hypothetical protein U0166_22935, partial [Acidobacteriota bacterium]
GNIDFEGRSEILTGPGPSRSLPPEVRGFEHDGAPIPAVDFIAYGTPRFGVNVASGGIDGDRFDEIVTGAGAGSVFGPHVRGWDAGAVSTTAKPSVNFFAYGTLRYGVNVATADLEPDAFDEVLTGAGPGPTFAPHVRGFDYDGTSIAPIAGVNFYAYAIPRGGVVVAGGDADGDGTGDIASCPGPDALLPARFVGFRFDGTAVTALPGFDVTPYTTTYGGCLAIGNVQSGRGKELITGAGPDPVAPSIAAAFHYSGTTLRPVSSAFAAFPQGSYGVRVGSLIE